MVLPFNAYAEFPLENDEIMEKEIEKMLVACTVVPSSSVWSFTDAIACRKDEDLRICVDYQIFNQITKQNRWLLPKIEEIIDKLKGSQFFPSLDLFLGYWQIKMEESC